MEAQPQALQTDEVVLEGEGFEPSPVVTYGKASDKYTKYTCDLKSATAKRLVCALSPGVGHSLKFIVTTSAVSSLDYIYYRSLSCGNIILLCGVQYHSFACGVEYYSFV